MNRILLISISLIIFMISISCVSAAGIGSGTGIGSYSTNSGTLLGAGGITFHGGHSSDWAFGPNHGNHHPDFDIPAGSGLYGPEPENNNVL